MATESPSAVVKGRKPRASEPGAPADQQRKGTRERILDIALDLFVEKGYDKTSLREIAAELGFSKAALYYHFASKEDILMALHQRLHALATGPLTTLSDKPVTVGAWVSLLDGFIDLLPANRKLIAMHERNRAAFEVMHNERHEQEHDDLEQALRRAATDPALPTGQRLRMAFAFAGMMGALIFAGDTLEELSSGDLVEELKKAVHGVLDA